MKMNMNSTRYISAVAMSLSLLVAVPLANAASASAPAGATLTLPEAEKIALDDEPGLVGKHWEAESLSERAIADGQLMDPKLQVGLVNLAADTFDFNQENMTQFKVGLAQQFPAGDTRKIKTQKTLKQSELARSELEARKLDILKDLRLTWLEIYYWRQAKNTISENRVFFAQLVDIVRSQFSVGRNNQQDLIRAQLELSRLDDRTTKITQMINAQRSKLSRWIGAGNSDRPLPETLPDLQIPVFVDDFEQLSQLFLSHPKVQEIDKKLEVAQKEIDLTKESYKPGWGVNVSYGYRDEMLDGRDRSDFLSAGVTVDLPLFTANRQDKKLLSSEYKYQALKNKRLALLRQLVANLKQEMANEEQLEKRQELYRKLLLPQAKQQAQAALLAYQSDRSDFADVMRAYIDDLNTRLDQQRIKVDRLQAKAKILFLMPNTASKSATEKARQED